MQYFRRAIKLLKNSLRKLSHENDFRKTESCFVLNEKNILKTAKKLEIFIIN